MKIAVPLFKERISPYFGSSSKILLVETCDAGICQEVTWDVGVEGAMEVARRLVDLGVKEVICGGIQKYYKDWLMRRGVKVLDNQKGVAREVLQRLLTSKG